MRRILSVLAALTLASCGAQPSPSDTPAPPSRMSATVTLIDADERPVVDAFVQASNAKFAASGHTDAMGKVTLSLVASALPYELDVHPGSRIDSVVRKEWTPQDTTVRVGTWTTVRGTVRDAAGKPVPEVAVLADWDEEESTGRVTDADILSNQDGTFVRKGTRRKPTVELRVVGTFSKPLVTKTIKPDGRPVDLTVPLGATLVVKTPNSEDAFLLSATEQSRSHRARGGRVRFVGLSEGERYTVWIPPYHGKYGFLEGVPADGQEREVPLTDGERIEGRLAWPGDTATASVEVLAVRGPLRVPQDSSSREVFRFSGLPKGVWTLTATTTDTPPLTAKLEAMTGSTVTLRLARQ